MVIGGGKWLRVWDPMIVFATIGADNYVRVSKPEFVSIRMFVVGHAAVSLYTPL